MKDLVLRDSIAFGASLHSRNPKTHQRTSHRLLARLSGAGVIAALLCCAASASAQPSAKPPAKADASKPAPPPAPPATATTPVTPATPPPSTPETPATPPSDTPGQPSTATAPTTPPAPETGHAGEPAVDAAKAEEKAKEAKAGGAAGGEQAAGEKGESEAKEATEGKEAKEGEEEEKKPKWYDSIDFSAFVDTYFSLNTNFPRPNNYSNLFRANDQNNGFSLAQAGLSVNKEADPIGGAIWFRFGPQVSGYGLNDSVDAPGTGLEFIRQAYLTWKPFDKLTIQLGKFDSPAGAEEIDSHDENYNYTRGLLHWFSQPTFHTGLMVTYEAHEMLKLSLLAVNGWNNTVDNNRGKTFGLYAEFMPVEGLTIAPTYMLGPEQADYYVREFQDGSTETLNMGSVNKLLRHLFDVWIYYEANENLSFLGNVDYARDTIRPDYEVEDTKDVSWFGVMISGRYAFAEHFAASLRGEYYSDPQGYSSFTDIENLKLYSGTLTLEASPSDYLLMKMDFRADYSNVEQFLKGANAYSKWQPTITLGVVAKTN